MLRSEFVIVLTTLPTKVETADFAKALIDDRLAACVSVHPEIKSFYMWESQIMEESEQQILIKTTANRIEELQSRVLDLHPYKVPELLVIPIIDGSESYLKWIKECTKAVEVL